MRMVYEKSMIIYKHLEYLKYLTQLTPLSGPGMRVHPVTGGDWKAPDSGERGTKAISKLPVPPFQLIWLSGNNVMDGQDSVPTGLSINNLSIPNSGQEK